MFLEGIQQHKLQGKLRNDDDIFKTATKQVHTRASATHMQRGESC